MMKERTSIIDWEDVHSRLRSRLSMKDRDDGISLDEAKLILSQRAKALAKPLETSTPATEIIELLIFSLADERFGVRTAQVLEATVLRELVPVPSTPACVLGVINHRGQILTVLDLARLLSLPGERRARDSKIIWAEAGGVTVGLIVDSVAGTISVSMHKVAPPPEVLTGLRLTLISGVTEDLVSILDLDALLQVPELGIDDEVA